MFTLILTACLVGKECATQDIAIFRSGDTSKELCLTAKEAFEKKYFPNLKEGDRASFQCKGIGEN